MTDNPRVETLWEYLKRNYGYRTGIVSTAAITDATPAVQGSHAAFRQMRLEIARWVREGKPDEEIRAEYERRYGAKVLVVPSEPKGWSYLIPWTLTAAGVVLLVLLIRRWRTAAASPGPAGDLPDVNLDDE